MIVKPHGKLLVLLSFLLIISCTSDPKKTTNDNPPNQNIKKDKLSAEDKQKGSPSPKQSSSIDSIVYKNDKPYLKALYEEPHIKEFYSWQGVEYNESVLTYPSDLSTLSYEELRLLRNEIFARNGHLFNDGFLRGYFNRFQWYMPIFDVKGFSVQLDDKEQQLINSILEEEAKRKTQKTIQKDGLDLYNAELITNSKQFTTIPKTVTNDFHQQNFSIVNANRAMPFFIYDNNAYQHVPHYITTDLYLFILHKYFSRFIEKLDESYLYPTLLESLKASSKKLQAIDNPKHQTAIEWAQTYNALALYAMGNNEVDVPVSYQSIFEEERQNIDDLSGKPAFIKAKYINYAELKPRGHYTKTENLKKYFRGFKWISLNGISLDKDDELKGIITLSYIIKSDSNLLNQYKAFLSTVEKLAGKEDNLSIKDILELVDNTSLDNSLSDENINQIRTKLKASKKEKIKTVDFSKANKKEDIKVHFLSSTYSISGEIFNSLISKKRKFPNGLDIPAVFNNTTAQNILTENYSQPSDYLPKLEKLQQQFSTFNDWNHNYGFKAVATALAASKEENNYPDFMKTDAYNRKELSTTLASWTHVKHDLILYQEKPFAAESGQGGGPRPPMHYSYVEPNTLFWESALELVNWLEQLTIKTSNFKSELKTIKKIGILLNRVANKQIEGTKVTDEEFEQLHYIGGEIEYILLSLLETDHLPDREKSMALIADVYAYNNKNLNVAVGHADDIYVIVPINNEYHIARGSVFSYYEFKGKIYNDEEWKAMINNNELPPRPKWLQPLIQNVKPLEGQMQFRYEGHDSEY